MACAASPLRAPGVSRLATLATFIVAIVLLVPADVAAAPVPAKLRGPGSKTSSPFGVLVRFRDVGSASEAVHRRAGGRARHRFDAPRGLELVELPAGISLEEGLSRYRAEPTVERAEPDWPIELHWVPNDPSFGEQWYLENTGQTGGAWDADINAAGAWDVTSGGPAAVIAVIDSGIDYAHPDLAANLWVNAGEIPGNGVDDDANGYVDDVHGIDALTGAGDPLDDLGHGTEMAGLVAAVGHNGIGIAGVAWSTRVLACKAIDAHATGRLSAVLACMDYVRALKRRATAPVPLVAINASWGGIPYSQDLADAIVACREAGILFITSAGNGGASVEDPTSLAYPARLGLPLVVSVGASDSSDRLARISDFGPTAVHLLAPGASLLVPELGGGWVLDSGTSHAAAVTSGVAALVASVAPALTPAELTYRLLAGAQPVTGAAGVTATGRRLRAFDAGGVGALSCAGQTVRARGAPPGESLSSVRGRSNVPLSMLHVGCDSPAGTPLVSVGGAAPIALADDGVAPDLFAGDGVYAGAWAVPGEAAVSSYTLGFPGGDQVTVRLLDTYHPAEAIPFAWRESTGPELPLADDAAVAVALPFAVPFGHGAFSTVWVHSNGYLDFASRTSLAENQPLPSRRLGTTIAPYWDDLDPALSGAVTWDVLGTAPHRELVVEWRDVAHHDTGGTLTFQVVLFEDSADVLFSYEDVSGGTRTDAGASATIGIQAAPPAAGGVATTYSTNAATLSAGTSLLWRANRAPVARAGPELAVRGGHLALLDGSGSSDPDGSTVSFAWRQLAGPAIALATADSPLTSFVAPQAPATIDLELAVTDADGVVSRARTRVVVDDTVLGVALAPPPAPVAEGEEVAVELVVSAAAGAAAGAYAVTWSWGDGASEAVTLAAPGAFVIRHAYADGDGSAFELEAEVTDGVTGDLPGPSSRTTRTRTSITVLNVPPLIEVARVTPRRAGVGEAVTIEVVASDRGEDAITYSFDLDGDGVLDVVDSPEARASTRFASAGAKHASVVARDDDGGEASALLAVSVTEGSGDACGCVARPGAPPPGALVLMLLLAGGWRRRRWRPRSQRRLAIRTRGPSPPSAAQPPLERAPLAAAMHLGWDAGEQRLVVHGDLRHLGGEQPREHELCP